jgi:protein ImuA
MPPAHDIAALRDRMRRLEYSSALRHGVLPFGVAAIDRTLPDGGLALGAVHEILGQGGDEEDGAAAAGFVAGIVARLGGGPVLWCLKRPDLYGPGLAAHGLDPARLVIVRAPRDEDMLWAVEEGLHSPGLAAVIGEIARLPMVASRRLQLAAERSGVTAFLLRRWRNAGEATSERGRPSAALTRWQVTALPSFDNPLLLNPLPRWGRGGINSVGHPRWRIELLRCRGGDAASWDVEVADATGALSLPAGLADRPAAPRRHASRPVPDRLAG